MYCQGIRNLKTAQSYFVSNTYPVECPDGLCVVLKSVKVIEGLCGCQFVIPLAACMHAAVLLYEVMLCCCLQRHINSEFQFPNRIFTIPTASFLSSFKFVIPLAAAPGSTIFFHEHVCCLSSKTGSKASSRYHDYQILRT